MVASGFAEEFGGVDLDDKRLNDRLFVIADSLGKSCRASIPAATNGRAEMEAAYRFFDNDNVSPEKLNAPHRAATMERIRQRDVVLLVQDTTELDLTRPSQQVEGAGPLTHTSRRGTFYHPLMAFDPEGLALGTVWNKHWARDEICTDRTPTQKRQDIRNKPIEEKESFRWLEGVDAALDVAREAPQTQCIVIADSESDIYEVLAAPRGSEGDCKLEIIVRAAGDRNIDDFEGKMLARVRDTPCLMRLTLDISKRLAKTNVKDLRPRQRGRDGRTAEVEIRATSIMIRSPRNGPKRPSLKYNIVLVEEISPPEGALPIQWILITSLPIATLDDVQKIVDYYCRRWQIEIYFKTLKSGCRVEERYFETMTRLKNCMAIYFVIAWKILYLCHIGRDCPDLPCDVIFDESEWKSVYTIVKRELPPIQAPTLNEMIRMIASLGGYVVRKKTEPGTQTLWLGLMRMNDLANAWDTFGPGSCPPT